MSDSFIEITVNGFKEKIVTGTTVAQLISEMKEMDHHLLVEYNNRLLHASLWDKTILAEEDVIEFIHPCFGG